MVATATSEAPGGASMDLPIHRLDLESYNRIVDSGALDGEHVQLIDGVLVQMSPQSPAHFLVLGRVMRHFAAAPRWWTGVQGPIEVAPDSAPEPDIAIHESEPPPGRHHRTALMAIEVAVSSQQLDREVKAPLYARAAIPTYWLIDVPARTVEVYTEPGEGGYARRERYGARDTLPCTLEGVADLDLATLFESA